MHRKTEAHQSTSVEVSEEELARFLHLKPGEYVFLVQGGSFGRPFTFHVSSK